MDDIYAAYKRQRRGRACTGCDAKRQVSLLCRTGHVTCEDCAGKEHECYTCEHPTYIHPTLIAENRAYLMTEPIYKCPNVTCTDKMPKTDLLEHIANCNDIQIVKSRDNTSTWDVKVDPQNNDFLKPRELTLKPHVIELSDPKVYIIAQVIKTHNEWQLHVSYLAETEIKPPKCIIEVCNVNGKFTGTSFTTDPDKYVNGPHDSSHGNMWISLGRTYVQYLSGAAARRATLFTVKFTLIDA